MRQQGAGIDGVFRALVAVIGREAKLIFGQVGNRFVNREEWKNSASPTPKLVVCHNDSFLS